MNDAEPIAQTTIIAEEMKAEKQLILYTDEEEKLQAEKLAATL